MSKQEEAETKTVIHRGMTIESILSLFPQKAQKLAYEITRAGLHCVGCHAATWETLEAGMKGHGKKEEEIDELVRRLNVLLEEETDESTISLTPRAAKEYLKILEEEGKQGWALRLADKLGGCNGYEYILDYSEKAEADDVVFESYGLQIHVKKHMLDRLLGTEIDYIEGLYNSGFKITNPNVRSSCGCGSSHGY